MISLCFFLQASVLHNRVSCWRYHTIFPMGLETSTISLAQFEIKANYFSTFFLLRSQMNENIFNPPSVLKEFKNLLLKRFLFPKGRYEKFCTDMALNRRDHKKNKLIDMFRIS
jgi:hypothetical protein